MTASTHPVAPVLQPLLRVKDVSQLLNVKVSTVYGWARMGDARDVRLRTQLTAAALLILQRTGGLERASRRCDK